MQQAPPIHLRGPTRPNWGGGKPLWGYNSLRRGRIELAEFFPKNPAGCMAQSRDRRQHKLAQQDAFERSPDTASPVLSWDIVIATRVLFIGNERAASGA